MIENDNLQCEINKGTYQKGSFADKVHKYLRLRDFNNAETAEHLENLFSEPAEPYLWFQGLLNEFNIHSKKKLKTLKEPQDTEKEIVNQWNEVGYHLARKVDPVKAEIFYQELYHLLLHHQEEIKKRIHKGTPLHQIGWVNFYFLKNSGKARRYIHLAFIEDLMSVELTKINDVFNAPAYRFLRDVFLLPEGYLKTFVSEITKSIKHLKDSQLKDSQLFFPEPLFLNFTTKEQALVRERSQEIFLGINKVYAQNLLERVEKARSNNEKKETLEDLMTYLFSTVERFEVRRNVLAKDAEIDLLVRNLIQGNPVFEEFGIYLLVECKNWIVKKVGAKEVRDFIGKLRFVDSKCGVLVFRDEITSGATRIILKEYHRDQTIIIPLSKKELSLVINEEIDFLSLLLKKYEGIRFDTL